MLRSRQLGDNIPRCEQQQIPVILAVTSALPGINLHHDDIHGGPLGGLRLKLFLHSLGLGFPQKKLEQQKVIQLLPLVLQLAGHPFLA
ncbi:hypothetical protein D3C75_1112910 [compost metagenome]